MFARRVARPQAWRWTWACVARSAVVKWVARIFAPDEATGRLFELAINGSWQIHPDATATQGYPICWSDAATTKRIHAALGPIEFSSLAAHFGTANFLAAEL